MCCLVALSCSQIGAFLVLRRMALIGDAISHSVLPGIVVAFLFVGSLSSPWLLIGAGVAGVGVTVLIELIHGRSRLKQDAAIGISFTSLFALGVLMISLWSSKVDLDPDCVLHGEVEQVPFAPAFSFGGVSLPRPIATMIGVLCFVVVLISLFYRHLLLGAFDAGLAQALGHKPHLIHYATMAVLSIVVVASFEAVGAILVIALLILPAATALLCVQRLQHVLLFSAIHAILSSFLGVMIAAALDANTAGCVVLGGAVLFVLGWLFGPVDGAVVKAVRRRRAHTDGGDSGIAMIE